MRHGWSVVVAAAFALGAAACAGPGRPSDGGGATGDELARQAKERDQQYQCDEGKEWWHANGTPKRGGTWRWSNQTQHLDAAAADGRWWYHGSAYEFLVKPRTCYYNDTAVIPDLAKSWRVSADHLTWTFKLRDDVKWHNLPPVNGRGFTSADAGWTNDYQKASGGLASFWKPIEHEEPDATTLVLKLKEPNADFLNMLASEQNVMLPREVKEQRGDFKNTLVGTGPFQLKEYRQGQQVIWERNPNYRAVGSDGKPLPYLDEIQQVYFADRTASVAAFRAGQLDRNENGGYFKLDSDAIKGTQGLKAKGSDNPAANMYPVWMRAGEAPWNDVRVRKAVSLAIDRDDIIGGLGGGGVQQGFLPSAVGGEYNWPAEKIKSTFKPDPERAKKLLAEAGHTGRLGPFTLKSSQGYAENIEVIQKQLEAVGIDLKLELAAGTAVTPVLSKKDFELAYGPWSGGRLPSFWLGEIFLTGSTRNITGYSDPKLDAMIAAQVKEMDNVKRKVQLDQIQDYLVETMPIVPTITRVYYHFESCRMKNMRPQSNSAHAWGVMEAWIDTEGC